MPPNNFVFHATTQGFAQKSWAVIDRPYSLGCATVGALCERPRCIFYAKPYYQSKKLIDSFAFTVAPCEAVRCPL